MKHPLVSVIIPNYNYARYLPQALDSVLAQTYPHVEIIVVDDGSVDDSRAAVQRYGKRVRYIQQQNQGVSAARNRGIKESGGEFVALLDADDFWHPEKLSRQLKLMSNPSVGLVYCGVQYIDAESEPISVNLAGKRGRLLKDMALLNGTCVLATGSTGLFRRKCIEKAGFFDLELSTAADWDLCLRIACDYEIEVVREPLLFYRLHRSSMHQNVALFEHDMLHTFKKMFANPAAKAIHPLRRRSYGRLYITLSGSNLYSGHWRKCLTYAVRSIVTWPLGLTYLASFPIRRIQRRFSASMEEMEPTI